jgi:hypothetical protein
MRVLAIAACTILSIGLSVAHADDAQKAKERAKACNKAASERQLSQDELRAFMKHCLASEGPVVAPDEPTKAVDREKECAIAAQDQSLTGPERDAYMKSCLAGGAT